MAFFYINAWNLQEMQGMHSGAVNGFTRRAVGMEPNPDRVLSRWQETKIKIFLHGGNYYVNGSTTQFTGNEL